MRNILLLIFMLILEYDVSGQETILQYLSGTDKDHTVKWDFMCTRGRNSGKWSYIQVPSNWEQQGFGTYNYYQDIQNPDEQGLYKYSFNLSELYKEKKIFIVFCASMTETEVRINGRSAGPIHQGGFYEFKYNITDLVQFDKPNLLEVTVSKRSTNNSINFAERKADFWMFGGIFRPVYLEILPIHFIQRVAINAQANGDFNMQVFSNAGPGQLVEAQVYQLNGKSIDKPFVLSAGDSILHHHFQGIQLWNPEQPNLYFVTVSIKEGGKIIHTTKQRFGFRTAELREQDGFYVNGTKILFKGVCRHSEWPETGRTLSKAVHLMDIKAMKDMNMNAVRMSHYPPDKEFLDLCDSIGLFVLDELTGWQAAYDTIVGRKLVKELVIRDVNHPSIVIWDNGNEGGWNRALDHDFALYDIQNRLVIHPWERFNGTNTKHYPDYKYVQEEVVRGKEVFFPTEFMHGLFDGGQGAALDDFWKAMMKHPHAAGGFLWSFHDEGIVRSDQQDSVDVAGNQAPDGILGPYRQKEASYFTIKEIWSPVYIETMSTGENFNGNIKVENRYLFTNLDQCSFKWNLVRLPFAGTLTEHIEVIESGLMKGPSVSPGSSAILHFPFSKNNNADAFYLYALNNHGDTICAWSWALQLPGAIVKSVDHRSKISDPTMLEHGLELTVQCDGIDYYFDKESGFLKKVFNGKHWISIRGGTTTSDNKLYIDSLHYFKLDGQLIIQVKY